MKVPLGHSAPWKPLKLFYSWRPLELLSTWDSLILGVYLLDIYTYIQRPWELVSAFDPSPNPLSSR